MKRLCCLLCLALVVIVGSRAERFFVSPSGSDLNPGSQGQPFRSISHSVSMMDAGDTVFIRGGNYHEEILFEGLNGTSDAPIVISSWMDEQVILDGSLPVEADWREAGENIFMAKIPRPVWQLFVDGRSMSSARWPNGNWDDGSIWDKNRSMEWPEKGKGKFGHYYNESLKELTFSLEQGGIIIVNSGSFKTYKGFITEHSPESGNFRFDTS